MQQIGPNTPATPIQGLIDLGFSEYEARAYLELLHNHPVGAYELSKASGIPSSKIYQTLARLVDQGAAMPVVEGNKTRYVPLDPKELVETRRLQLDRQLNGLENSLLQETRDIKLSYIWNLNEYTALQDQLRMIIRETRSELVLSCWVEELTVLGPDLLALGQQGAKIAIVLFGNAPLDPAVERELRIYRHPIEDTLYAERGGRGLTMASDGKRAIVATISGKQQVEGAWSLNRGFVLMAEDYIKHDIYLMKIVRRMDPQLSRVFGNRYRLLRDVFNDQEEGK